MQSFTQKRVIWADTILGDTDFIYGIQAMGSSIKAQTLGINITRCSGNWALSSGQVRFYPVYLRTGALITGVKWYQVTQGNYTANASCQVGLYTVSGNTFTLVASSTDDGTIWKAASNSMGSKAFDVAYPAAAGLYFIALLYHSSAEVTAPALGAPVSLNASAQSSADLTNGQALSFATGGVTALPQTTTTGALGANNTIQWCALY